MLSWGPSPEYADWWYGVSWKGLIAAGLVTAVAAAAVVIFTALQFWSDGIRDSQAELRTKALEAQAAVAMKQAATANEASEALKLKTREVELALEKERIARLQLEEKQAALLKHQAQRALTKEQTQTLTRALSPFAGQKVTIASILGDSDGKEFAEEFAAVLRAAGWDHGGDAGIIYSAWDKEPVGIEITLNEADARAGRMTPGIEALIRTMRRLGLTHPSTVFMNAEVPKGQVQVKIGRKVPPR